MTNICLVKYITRHTDEVPSADEFDLLKLKGLYAFLTIEDIFVGDILICNSKNGLGITKCVGVFDVTVKELLEKATHFTVSKLELDDILKSKLATSEHRLSKETI